MVEHALLDHLVRLQQQQRRNRQAQRLGRLRIDDQLELRGLLDGQISRLGAFQELVDVDCGAPSQVGNANRDTEALKLGALALTDARLGSAMQSSYQDRPQSDL